LLLEDQYAVGDYVTIGGVTGTIEELGMRITRLRDDEGRLYILSNGDIAQVCNMSRGPLAGTLEIAIAASADVSQANEILNAAFAKMADSGSKENGRENDSPFAEPPRVEGIAAADAAKTTLRVRFRARPGERPGDVALRLREVARNALRDAEIPLA
jgi:small conductance mechanosensitive channel